MADGKHLEDLRLVRAVLRGSVPAWHELIHRHGGVIESVLRRKLYDADEVRDVFVGLLHDLLRHKLRSYRGDASLSTWLAVVARRAATDSIRRRLGRWHGSESANDRVTNLEHYLREERARRQASTPEQELLDADRDRLADALPRLLESLPDTDRRAIVLRFERGMSAHRIAREMGLKDRRKAYTLVDRAIRRLRRLADDR